MSIAPDGRLGSVQQRLALPGQPGPHRKEQPFAKPHFNPFSPDGRFVLVPDKGQDRIFILDRKSTRLNSSHLVISYAVFCLKKKKHLIPLSDTTHHSESDL